MELKLGDVQETALIPLSNRAGETKRKNPRIKDPKAVEIVSALQLDIKKYDKLVTHECVIARTIMFDSAVKDLIEEDEEAICINIGCGMDDRFSRVDNGKIRWFDVDLPDSIAARRRVFSDTERRRMIGGSVLETGWIKEIKSYLNENQSRVIVIAEGLFMYFTKEQNRRILRILAESFPAGNLVVELMKPCMMNEKRHQTVRKTNAKFGWGTNSGRELEILEPRMHLVSEHSFSEQMLQSTWTSKVVGFLFSKLNNRLALFRWE